MINFRRDGDEGRMNGNDEEYEQRNELCGTHLGGVVDCSLQTLDGGDEKR